MLVRDGPKSEAAFWLIAICKMSTPICMISINQNPKRVKLASLFIFRSVQKSYNQIKWFHFLSHAIYYYPIIIQQSDGKQLVSTSFNCWQTETKWDCQHNTLSTLWHAFTHVHWLDTDTSAAYTSDEYSWANDNTPCWCLLYCSWRGPITWIQQEDRV